MFKQITPTQIKEIPLEDMDNSQLRDTLCNAAMKCANALSAYAVSKGNVLLQGRIGYTHSGIKKMRNIELETVCQMICDEARAQISEAGAFGYSNEDLKALEERIEAFHEFVVCRARVNRSPLRGYTQGESQMRKAA